MIDRRQPMPHHYVIEPQFFQDSDRVHRAVVTITSFEQLAPALADADHAVVIDNPKIERSLERLYAWQRIGVPPRKPNDNDDDEDNDEDDDDDEDDDPSPAVIREPDE